MAPLTLSYGTPVENHWSRAFKCSCILNSLFSLDDITVPPSWLKVLPLLSKTFFKALWLRNLRIGKVNRKKRISNSIFENGNKISKWRKSRRNILKLDSDCLTLLTTTLTYLWKKSQFEFLIEFISTNFLHFSLDSGLINFRFKMRKIEFNLIIS